MKKSIALFTLSIIAFATFAQHDHHDAGQDKSSAVTSFKDPKISNAYAHYLKIKDALVSSNAADAKKAAGDLQESLQAVPNGTKALAEATKIFNASTIDEQRTAFSELSNEMKIVIKSAKFSSGAVYVEFCPMANNNLGAFWLSSEKEIRNPYFGDKMLKCGSVKEIVQ
jgi:hypothetical protein